MADLEHSAPAGEAKTKRSYSAITDEILDYLNLLDCAWHALNDSPVVDGDEAAAKARNGLRICTRQIHELMDELEHWKMDAERRRRGKSKPKARERAAEVAHV